MVLLKRSPGGSGPRRSSSGLPVIRPQMLNRYDIYGDGSIVVVPAPGHTPGSVIISVTLHNGTRYAFVGDLVYQMEGITLREERSWLVRRMGADEDTAGNRENLLRIIALKERLPDLIIVPAHDRRGFDKMPRLVQARGESLVRDGGITAMEGN